MIDEKDDDPEYIEGETFEQSINRWGAELSPLMRERLIHMVEVLGANFARKAGSEKDFTRRLPLKGMWIAKDHWRSLIDAKLRTGKSIRDLLEEAWALHPESRLFKP